MDQYAADGIGGNNYWFTNMYHFINQWDHLKELKSAAPLAIHYFGAPQDYKNLSLPKSQEVVGRLISLGVRASWTEEEAHDFGMKLKASIEKALA